MTTAGHPLERLVDLLDGRLDPAEAAAVRTHLEGCTDCRREVAWLAAGRAAAVSVRSAEPAPADLMARVTAALDDVDRSAASPSRPPRMVRRLLWGGLAAAAALVLVVAAPWRSPAADPVIEAQAAYVAIRGGTAGLTFRTGDAVALERFFAEAGSGQRVRVIDLAMMGWSLEGGALRRLGTQPSALYAYRSAAGERLVCQMYPGRLADLPAADGTRTENGFEFRVYSRGGVTLVFWQEGDLVCVLAADLPADEVVALAVAKAMAPP
jgi:anti-sigma factor RsiW